MPNILAGRRVFITRPQGQERALADRLKAIGAKVEAAPAIRLRPPRSWKPLDAALKRISLYDAAAFTSVNGVERFFSRAKSVLGKPPPRPRALYAIGPGTAAALAARGWHSARVPARYEGEALARAFGKVRGWRILIPRARVAREVLPRLLRGKGAQVDVVSVYETVPDRRGLARLKRAARSWEGDWITFTSASTVEAADRALGRRHFREIFSRSRAASIGPITSAALRNSGVEPAVEAKRFTAEGLARAIADFSRPEPLPELKAVLVQALNAGGKVMRERFLKVAAKKKGGWRANLVTAADLAAERAILKTILNRFPGHDFLAEESPARRGRSEYLWVVDPIDGTTNYAHGYPACCVSIGLLHRGKPLMGGVLDPFRSELFFAEKGKGAFMNGNRLRVSLAARVAESLLITGFAYDRDRMAGYYLRIVEAVLKKSHGIRRSGSAALDLAWVAAGRADGFWEFRLNPWDVAAGRLLVEEAGGTISDFYGQPWGSIDNWGKQTLATNGRILGEMSRLLKKFL